ncbi:MAG: GNAT family N-acetyltransferase [Chromatiales bacterium]|nr:GNAT family N-acetyltransferase [Chromatiales bacterium]
MSPLHDILTRNLGSRLTPELAAGIIHGYESAVPDALCTAVATRPSAPPSGTASPRLVVDDKESVGLWVARRLGMSAARWGEFNAIGWLDRPGGSLVAGVVVEGVTATNAFMHVAFSGRYALKRGLIYATFDYVFNQLGLERVTGVVDAGNAAALRFDQHLGFEPEFVIPRGNGGDVVQLVMWRDRCRWIKRASEASDGQ